MDVKEIAIDRAIKFLNSAGAKYYIVLEDKTFGDISFVLPEKPVKKRIFKYKKNEVMDLWIGSLKLMNPGDVTKLTGTNTIPAKVLRSSITSWCTRTWGKESYITKVDHHANTVEVLRVC